MPLKPLPITGACLLIMLQATSQTIPGIINRRPSPRKINWVISWNAGIFFYHKNYNTLNVDLPYTSKDVSSGNITAYDYKTTLVNFFTKPAGSIDVLNVEAQTRNNHGYLSRLSIGGQGSLNFMLGYELILPLSKSRSNGFVLKPSVSVCIYRFAAKFDSTIDNNQKIITIGGKTFGDTFAGGSDDDDEVLRQASYLKPMYIQNNVGVFPQMCIAHQSPRHKFYYSLSVGWLQQIYEHRSVIDISPYDEHGNRGRSETIPVHFQNNFSGFSGSLAVGFFFNRI